jgi:hypothetical protein
MLEKFDILFAGTVRSNRVGWPKVKMTLAKSSRRGVSLVKYDTHNKIMCIQWVDNKVVSLISTLQLSGEDVCSCLSGSNVLHLAVSLALKAYQQGMRAWIDATIQRTRSRFCCKITLTEMV